MLSKFRTQNPNPRAHIWDGAIHVDWGHTLRTLENVVSAWRKYQALSIDEEISEHEDMVGSDPDARNEYRKVGLTALRALTEAMVLTGKTEFSDILDLPCGGGRVTRHVRAFFPNSNIYVADIDSNKLESVITQFGARKFEFPHDFHGDPGQCFDLIFSGSLLTHFDIDMFERAVDFFVRALNPGGVAVLTVHGRIAATLSNTVEWMAKAKQVEAAFREHMRQVKKNFKFKLDPELAIKDFRENGFGYFMSPSWTSMYGQSYGGSYSSPSWLMRLFERRSDCIIVGFKEKSYGDMQDIVIIQKL